jgi:UDP:flavonoid glycosyltransferase YjiC (YdhE family)
LHEAGEQATVSAEVEEFLAGGPAPVLFTPGTAAAQQTKFFRESVEACRLAGLRGMLVTSHSQQIPRDLPPGVRAFSYVPFGKVLRRCSALVYHGGVGTLAQGIKAGIPHLVVPNSHDQPDNARRVEQLGLGCRVYPERYKAARVAQILGHSRTTRRSGIAARNTPRGSIRTRRWRTPANCWKGCAEAGEALELTCISGGMKMRFGAGNSVHPIPRQ